MRLIINNVVLYDIVVSAAVCEPPANGSSPMLLKGKDIIIASPLLVVCGVMIKSFYFIFHFLLMY